MRCFFLTPDMVKMSEPAESEMMSAEQGRTGIPAILAASPQATLAELESLWGNGIPWSASKRIWGKGSVVHMGDKASLTFIFVSCIPF